MKNKKLQTLCVCAIMIALSTALSLIKIWNMPWGGSITLLSMLPVALVSIMFGVKQGLFSAFIYSCIQLVFGITMDGLLGWGLSAEMLIACILLDYIAAFTVIGLSGLFSKKGISGVVSGTVLAQGKSKKIVVFKYKAKKNERKKQGHRQPFTAVKILEIVAT